MKQSAIELLVLSVSNSIIQPRDRVVVSVVMAVYNEESTVCQTIDKLLAKKFKDFDLELIIVESQSTDSTQKKIRPYESHKNVKIIYQDKPRGKGNAVREGFKYATGSVFLIQDADDEYSPDDYPSLVLPILDGRRDFVLGTRHKQGEAMRVMEGEPLNAKMLNLGHHFFVWFFNTLYGTKLTDPFTMYKVFRRECIEGLEFKSDRFDFDWELVGKLVRRSYIPLEIPISYNARGFIQGKKVRFFRDPITWIIAAVRFRFEKI